VTDELSFAASQVLIIDTGPLWELVLYSAVHELGFTRLSSDIVHLRDRDAFQKLTEFIARFRTRTTSPHVVAEISRHLQTTQKKGHLNLWEITCRQFSAMGLDEKLVKLLEMPSELLGQFGAVDTGLLQLGINVISAKPCLLTTDAPLLAEFYRSKLPGIHLQSIIS